MAKMYLKGSDVEPDIERQRARLCGISNETYVFFCQTRGRISEPKDTTEYCFPIKEKMSPVVNELGEPVLNNMGQQSFINTGDFCSEVDTEQAEYACLPAIHVNRLVDRETIELDGWFINES